jgi:hypothetical protein
VAIGRAKALLIDTGLLADLERGDATHVMRRAPTPP